MKNCEMEMDLRPRRGLHSEKKAESPENDEHSKVLKVCKICNEVKYIEDNINDQLETEHEGDSQDTLDLSNFVCEDCCNKTAPKSKVKVKQVWLKKIISLVSKSYWILTMLVCVCLALLLSVSTNYGVLKRLYGEDHFDVNVYNQTPHEKMFDDELYGLEQIYTKQEEKVWFTFAAGIKSVIASEPNMPSVFLLLYDNEEAEKTLKCLVKDVTRVASKYLMKHEIEPLKYAGTDLNNKKLQNDPGQLLEQNKEAVRTRGAMVVTNLQDVHPNVAASFHFFCDRYTPAVEKAVFIFTLKVPNIPKASLNKVAEDEFERLWKKDLPENKLYPLITRLTGNVLKIVQDYSNC